MIDSLSDILDASCISTRLKEKRKPDVIRELVEILQLAGKIEDADAVTAKVLERESLTTTGIGGGIAIPHGMSADTPEMVMAFGRHPKGVKFDAVDRKPVKLFFLIVGPEGARNEQLRILSKISRYLHDPNFKNGLLRAESPEEVVQLFAEREG